jgi:hypothetical protein
MTNTTNSGERLNPDSRAAAVEDAKLLLHHVIKQGVELPEATTKILIEITTEIESKGWNAASELTFWGAYAELAKAARPVTAESLRALASSNMKPPRAVTEVVLTSIVTGIALALLLALQIYWVIGSNIVSTIDRLAAEGGRLKTQMLAAEYRRQLPSDQSFVISGEQQGAESNARPAPRQTGETPEAQFLRAQLDYESSSRMFDESKRALDANYVLLNDWRSSQLNFLGSKENWGPRGAVPVPEDPQARYEQEQAFAAAVELGNTIALNEAKSTLQSMASYVLPLLYGLVGACAYVLRAISRDMRDVVFFAGSPVHYRLRLLLGALSGIAIGWFFTPEQLPSGLAGIQPLALAFLAGYSVELLFAAMDRFISAFSGESRPQGK